MKSTKPSDLRGLTENELKTQIDEAERSLTELRFRLALGQLESPAAIRTVRRDIARMKTILRQRELEIQR